MGHQDSGDASLHENGLDFFTQLLPEMHVEVAKRLIEEEQLWSRCQGTRQCHALLLAPGEFVWIALGHAFQSYES